MEPNEQTMEVQRNIRKSRISLASNAVADLPKNDISELKSYASPPTTVKDVLTAAMILLGKNKVDWKDTKKYLGDTSLLKDIKDLDYESVTPDANKKAVEILSKYSTEKVKKVSLAAAAIYDWADAVSKE